MKNIDSNGMNNLPPIPQIFSSTIASLDLDTIKAQKPSKLIIDIGKPVKDVICVNSIDWRCPVRIKFEKQTYIKSVCGIDSLQSLTLAFQYIKAELIRITQSKDVVLSQYGKKIELQELLKCYSIR